ncbi:MAG TPA: histidine kinase [Pseudonocardiaceae bacterium]|nr:histidine kinase [Pseudonocardiaceae bacterium]
MVEVRPVPRLVRVFEDYFVERRWWQFLPIPLIIISLALYRGPYRIAGGSVLTYTLAGLALAAGALMLALPRAKSWLGITTMSVMCVCGGLLAITIPRTWTIVLPYVLASVAARRYTLRPAMAMVGAATVTIVIAQLSDRVNWLSITAMVAILVAVTMGALARRTRAERLDQMELALARAQTAREEHAKAAALAERARIAREVHDVLAHSLSALSLNLQGARLMLAKEGASEQAQEQVRRAQRLAAEGLAEARRAVAALREDPVPAARAIADLVTSSRLETGTPTELVVEGIPRDLPGPAEDTLYRTAQEALSNARKHAAGAPVHVLLAYRDGSTELTVTDHQEHRPANAVAAGYGLTGMRERADLIGGELRTGPTDDGWQVRLVVPA